MKEKLNYAIEEICDYCRRVVGYSLLCATTDCFYTLAKVDKEEGEALIKTIESYHNYYDYYEYTTNFGCLCRVYYFDVEAKERVEEKRDVAVYGHCRYCGGRTFVEVPRVPGTIFDYGDPDLMCKTCGRIIVESELIYERVEK